MIADLTAPSLANAPMHHVGIVQATEEDAAAMMALLGLEEDYRGFVPEWHALCIFTHPRGASPVEFVVPSGGPLVKFNKGAGGLHHIALQVPDLEALASELAEQDMRLLEPQHVKGAGNFLCNFLSPLYTRGLTVEFVQVLD
ncbi:MAG: VOC family protein [Phenylobacterium sp.]|uniref:VOC family protein n=1 Tax=Phenylobacterium sp. TaxID=1871053 RepID=UPI0025DF8D91|nr:VOC family protein [Phenylobacterium sp.]MBI1198458.1 VOC family protein [Phenylobacterium sp.]